MLYGMRSSYDDDEATSGEDIALEDVNWDAVTELQGRYDEVLAIENDDDRLAAARALAAEMHQGEN